MHNLHKWHPIVHNHRIMPPSDTIASHGKCVWNIFETCCQNSKTSKKELRRIFIRIGCNIWMFSGTCGYVLVEQCRGLWSLQIALLIIIIFLLGNINSLIGKTQVESEIYVARCMESSRCRSDCSGTMAHLYCRKVADILNSYCKVIH